MSVITTHTRNRLSLLLLLPIVLSCSLAGAIKNASDKAQKPKTLTSTDGKVQMVVPGSWNVDKTLNDAAVIQASNRFTEMYVIVLKEGKGDFTEDTTLEDYAALASSGMQQNITEAQATEPVALKVAGHSALEYQLSGSVEKVKIKYLCTAVETPNHFYQIITWTLPSRFEQNQETLRSVTQGFKESESGTAPAAAPSP